MPLEGIVVVAVEVAVAAPFATRHLADLGARVIKIERPPRGDFARGYDNVVRGTSSVFAWLNRSKESVTLDLKHPQAAGVLSTLIGRADVVVQNLTPSAAKRLGLDSSTLVETYPKLVACAISGFGQSGPYRDRKAYDLLIQAETGMFDVTGTPDEPCRVGISVADIAGGMYALSSILASLVGRASSGRGAAVEVSLFEALSEWLNHAMYFTMNGGDAPLRTGTKHGLIVPYGVFVTANDAQMVLAVQNDEEWSRLCREVLGRADLAADPSLERNQQRIARRLEVEEMVTAAVSELTRAELVERLEKARIAYADVSAVADLPKHPQHLARNRWRDVAIPGGVMSAMLPPFNLGDAEVRMDAVPALGEHSLAVMEWLGYSSDEVDAMQASGLFGNPAGERR